MYWSQNTLCDMILSKKEKLSEWDKIYLRHICFVPIDSIINDFVKRKTCPRKNDQCLATFCQETQAVLQTRQFSEKKKKMNGAKERQRPHAQSLTLDGS